MNPPWRRKHGVRAGLGLVVTAAFALTACGGSPIPKPVSEAPAVSAPTTDPQQPTLPTANDYTAGTDGDFCQELRLEQVRVNAERGDNGFGSLAVDEYPLCFGLPTPTPSPAAVLAEAIRAPVLGGALVAFERKLGPATIQPAPDILPEAESVTARLVKCAAGSPNDYEYRLELAMNYGEAATVSPSLAPVLAIEHRYCDNRDRNLQERLDSARSYLPSDAKLTPTRNWPDMYFSSTIAKNLAYYLPNCDEDGMPRGSFAIRHNYETVWFMDYADCDDNL